jgi:hypothetical protein
VSAELGESRPPLGTTRPVWHVIGPERAWWICHSRKSAERHAKTMKTAQITEGVETLSKMGELTFWDVRRPEWRP